MCLSHACVFALCFMYQYVTHMKVFQSMCMPLCVCCKDMSDNLNMAKVKFLFGGMM